jgi:hypothetical protein
MPKATKAQVAQRIDEVLRIRIDGAEFHDVQQYAAEKGWGVGERQLWVYMHRADDLLKERLEKDRDRLIARHVAQRRNLYARALNAGQYGVALATADSEAKLENLFPAKAISVNQGAKPDDTDLSADDRLAALARLRARVDEGGGSPAADGANDADGPLPGGPGEDSGRGGPGPGPLAGRLAEGGAAADAAPGEPPER